MIKIKTNGCISKDFKNSEKLKRIKFKFILATTHFWEYECCSDKRQQCVVYGSEDSTISIWNLLEKRQEIAWSTSL